ncbi:hypothetical protein Bpfe_010992, partial [Biomphalaria pfeifferi]
WLSRTVSVTPRDSTGEGLDCQRLYLHLAYQKLQSGSGGPPVMASRGKLNCLCRHYFRGNYFLISQMEDSWIGEMKSSSGAIIYLFIVPGVDHRDDDDDDGDKGRNGNDS